MSSAAVAGAAGEQPAQRRQCFQCRRWLVRGFFLRAQWGSPSTARARCLRCLRVWIRVRLLTVEQAVVPRALIEEYIDAWAHDRSGGVVLHGKTFNRPERSGTYFTARLRPAERAVGHELYRECSERWMRPVLLQPYVQTVAAHSRGVQDEEELTLINEAAVRFATMSTCTTVRAWSLPPATCWNDWMSTLRLPARRAELTFIGIPEYMRVYDNSQREGDTPAMIFGMKRGSIVRDVNGTVLFDSNGVLVAARLPELLPSAAVQALDEIVTFFRDTTPYLSRESTPSISAAYNIVGVKEDYLTKQMMLHQWCLSGATEAAFEKCKVRMRRRRPAGYMCV